MNQGDDETLGTAAFSDILKHGGIAGISSRRTRQRMETDGIPVIVLRMTIMAIADALSAPPAQIWEAYDRQHRRRIKNKRDYIWSAWRWLFNDYEDEFNFRDVCRMLGISVEKARAQIIWMHLSGKSIPGIENRNRPYACLDLVDDD